jgi:spermidine dehydrogenase
MKKEKPTDRELGIDRPITRRDVLHGIGGAALGAVGAPWLTLACGKGSSTEHAARPATGAGLEREGHPYPPALTGLRGSHPGSFEAAHERAWDGATWPHPEVLDETYDLVVVGGGVSGLAAAYFYRKAAGSNARILILDNHDDFGGHAKRNEFEHAGHTYLALGGSVFLEYAEYSDVMNDFLRELGVDIQSLVEQQDPNFIFGANGLPSGIYFDADHYGRDVFIEADIMPLAKIGPDGVPTLASRVDSMPLSQKARRELKRLLIERTDHLPEIPDSEKPAALSKISYRDFLMQRAGVSSESIALLQKFPHAYQGYGTDVMPAIDALMLGMPGLRGLGGFGAEMEREFAKAPDGMLVGAIFADGNASVARLLARSLVPEVAPGHGMNDIVNARFDYSKLDTPGQPVRIRLGSIAVHADPLAASSGVDVTYIRGGRDYRVRARNCVMACNNGMIPFLCPSLPDAQKEALRYGERTPLVVSNVLLRSGEFIDRLGASNFYCPGRLHSTGWVPGRCLGRDPSDRKPGDPQIVQLMGATAPEMPGTSLRDQLREGRHRMLDLSFEDYERELRAHLAGMLGSTGFEPARDILAITVNRWPHGYAYEGSSLFDPSWPDGEAPKEVGRRRFGRIAIANSDAAWSAYLDGAVDEAHRAVNELVNAGLV